MAGNSPYLPFPILSVQINYTRRRNFVSVFNLQSRSERKHLFNGAFNFYAVQAGGGGSTDRRKKGDTARLDTLPSEELCPLVARVKRSPTRQIRMGTDSLPISQRKNVRWRSIDLLAACQSDSQIHNQCKVTDSDADVVAYE